MPPALPELPLGPIVSSDWTGGSEPVSQISSTLRRHSRVTDSQLRLHAVLVVVHRFLRVVPVLPGATLATAHLAQLLFIQILRAHMETDAVLSAGWFRALGDRRLAPALALMHGEPARNWRLEELADACAMSRTTFALRFRTTAGVPALTYLAEWRMRLAERALRMARRHSMRSTYKMC